MYDRCDCDSCPDQFDWDGYYGDQCDCQDYVGDYSDEFYDGEWDDPDE